MRRFPGPRGHSLLLTFVLSLTPRLPGDRHDSRVTEREPGARNVAGLVRVPGEGRRARAVTPLASRDWDEQNQRPQARETHAGDRSVTHTPFRSGTIITAVTSLGPCAFPWWHLRQSVLVSCTGNCLTSATTGQGPSLPVSRPVLEPQEQCLGHRREKQMEERGRGPGGLTQASWTREASRGGRVGCFGGMTKGAPWY